MILVIRISGQVEMRGDFTETLFRMRMRKKYSAVLLKETEASKHLLQAVRNFVAFGKIDQKTLEELIAKRGELKDSKSKIRIDAKAAAETIMKDGIEKTALKPFFRLHPPRKGINSKLHYPKGVLGDNGDKINELVRRML
jgi:large subunit ribosomal protein L30